MHINTIEKTSFNRNSITAFCRECGRKLVQEIQRTKSELASQFRKAFAGNERMLRLVLNEAEALAFTTDYPQLFFPSLALEKIQNASAWQRHQLEVIRK